MTRILTRQTIDHVNEETGLSKFYEATGTLISPDVVHKIWCNVQYRVQLQVGHHLRNNVFHMMLYYLYDRDATRAEWDRPYEDGHR